MKTVNNNPLPVNLQLHGRNCLVVGAGKAACHKIKSLLECGAKLTVIAPCFAKEVSCFLSKSDFKQRDFIDEDIHCDIFLVIAATDNERINDQIISSCRAKKILCSRLDSKWSEGDFFRPASFSHNGFTVSVSTRGKSCRAARLMKSMLTHEVMTGSQFDCLLTLLPKPAPADDLKRDLLAIRGITDVHTFYTAKYAVITALTFKGRRLAEMVSKIVLSYCKNAEIYFGKDAFFHPIIKHISVPEKESFSKEWVQARHTGEVLTYNKFIGKINC